MSEKIKKEVFTPFYDNKYGKITLMELFFKDKNFYKSKYKNKEISEYVIDFLKQNIQKLQYVNETVTIAYFREQEYKKLIDEYCAKRTKQDKANNLIEKTVQRDSNKIKFEVKSTDKSRENIVFGLLSVLTEETNLGDLKWEVKKVIKEDIEFVKFVAITKSKAGQSISIEKTVKNGILNYIIERDRDQMSSNTIGELENAIWNQNPKVLLGKVHAKTEEEKEFDKLAYEIENIERKEEFQRIRKQQKQILEKQKEEERKSKLKDQQDEFKLLATQLAKRVAKEILKEEQNRKDCELKEKGRVLPKIGFKDFVVRRHVFKCMHENHKLENIVANITIITKNNEEKQTKVNAGYCSNCKIFFILESTYENLKNKGIPICRISDEKTYLKNYSINGMMLAKESILMQYGYNVNQQEGLSASRRQKILAVLIDKQILRKSEIISYLDFFISQRQTQAKYQVAIAKWEADREFVENYRIGEYHQYGVKAIYRR